MGFLRLVLALFVVVSHTGGHLTIPLGSDARLAMFNIGGRNAVGLFFMISGFYMSLILSDKYRTSLKAFYLNRFLRIFPTYWLVLLLCVVLTPGNLEAIVATLRASTLGAQLYFAAANLLVFGSDLAYLVSARPSGLVWDPYQLSRSHNGGDLLVVAPIFSVGLELVFYAIAPLLVRSPRWAFAALWLSIGYHVAIVASGRVNVVFQYHVFPPCLLYFSLGILAHQLQSVDWRALDTRTYVVGVLTASAILMIKPLLPNLYLLLFPFVIPALFAVTRSSRADRFIGDLSYPLYLVHYPVLKCFEEHGVQANPAMVTAASLALALVIHLGFELPIERLRQRNVTPQRAAA